MYFSFSISFPYKIQKDQIDYIEKTYVITKNKSLEIQLSKWGNGYTLFGIRIIPSWYRSHSGLEIELELFNYSLIINFCDNRHWDYQKGTWSTEDE
jgi:hypothetical protein